MTNPFQKAVRKNAKLRLGLTGPSGSGKTYSAIRIAKGIVSRTNCRVAYIDTENGSASLYADLLDFDVVNLTPPYTPERFIEMMDVAEKSGYGLIIQDSVTHEWGGPGGCLELVDSLKDSKFRGNQWSAWSEVKPRHRRFLDRIVASPCHIICCMRSKMETAQTESGGRKKVVKLGMKAEQDDGFEYELTTVLDITHETHTAMASKDRTGLFVDKDPEVLTEAHGEALLDWLNGGAPEPTIYEKMKAAIFEAGQADDNERLVKLVAAMQQRCDQGKITQEELKELTLCAETYTNPVEI